MRARRENIGNVLREQIARAVAAGSLKYGDRLPSTRELAGQLDADPRVIAAAYRSLEAEGIVEMRPRSGIFYASGTFGGNVPSTEWLVTALAGAVNMGVALPAIGEWMKSATSSRTIRAAVIAATADQSRGICRELTDSYGIDSHSVDPAELPSVAPTKGSLPAAVRQADLLLSTPTESARVARLAERHQKRHVTASVRTDLLGFEWHQLLLRPAYIVAADRKFLSIVRNSLRDMPEAAGIRYMIAGEDDLSRIPRDAPTYVTQAAREKLRQRNLPGFVLPPARLLSPESARDIIACVVELNRDESMASRR